MTQFASALQGFQGGMELGMRTRENKQREQYLADQNRRANEAHEADMQYNQVRMDTQLLNNEITKRTAEMAKTKDGIEQIKMLAGGYAVLMDAAANGKPVPADAYQAFNSGLDAILGPMVNETGPAHLDQKISRLEMTPQGARVMLHNTNRETGESYEAPMTLNRQAGEKTEAIIPTNDLLGGMRTMIKSAVQAGVDPRVFIHAMEGGETWVDSTNEHGIRGQRNTLTGKFDEGRESAGERAAAAAAAAEAARNAELNWQERNAGRIAGMELDKQRATLKNKQQLKQEFPELNDDGLQSRLELFDKEVANIRGKIGTKDALGNVIYDGSMADRAIAEMARDLGITEHVQDRLPPVQLSPGEQQQIDAAAAADVENVYGMFSSKDKLKQFGGATNKEDAIRYQQEQRRNQAIDQKRMGMGLPPLQQQTGGGSAAPKVGEVRKGYRFKGGNPADRNNWEKVQ